MTHRPDHEVELFQDEGVYRVFADLPDRDPEDIDVRFHDGHLSITVHREAADEGDVSVHTSRVSVPRPVVAEAVSATYRDGVLTVDLPIDEEGDRRTHRVDVET
jgi:HSP20 family protein